MLIARHRTERALAQLKIQKGPNNHMGNWNTWITNNLQATKKYYVYSSFLSPKQL